MSSENESSTKVYIEIVRQLRLMIEQEGLKAGDKIPSERELAERLNVGRSSVREALRAIELLGLIETKRGEGTFIRDFRGNQLVQLLSTFILQDKKVIKDVQETKTLIEENSLYLAFSKMSKEDSERLKKWTIEHNYDNIDFFTKVLEFADNQLIGRIWRLLSDYCLSLEEQGYNGSKQKYIELAEAMRKGNWEQVLKAYRKLRNLSFDR